MMWCCLCAEQCDHTSSAVCPSLSTGLAKPRTKARTHCKIIVFDSRNFASLSNLYHDGPCFFFFLSGHAETGSLTVLKELELNKLLHGLLRTYTD